MAGFVGVMFERLLLNASKKENYATRCGKDLNLFSNFMVKNTYHRRSAFLPCIIVIIAAHHHKSIEQVAKTTLATPSVNHRNNGG